MPYFMSTIVDHPDATPWSASLDFGAAQADAIIKAAVAGKQIFITWLVLSNGAVAGNITLLDGAGGSVLFELYPGINGGVTLNNIHIELTVATLLALTSTLVTTHAINIGGYVAT